jgi:erythromycin esterase-like protein
MGRWIPAVTSFYASSDARSAEIIRGRISCYAEIQSHRTQRVICHRGARGMKPRWLTAQLKSGKKIDEFQIN